MVIAAATKTKKPFYVTVGRLIIGVILTVFGLNGFLNFLPVPQGNEHASAFITAIINTGYLFPLVKGMEVIAGIFMLTNRLVFLAAIFISPVVVNIFLYNTLLDSSGWWMGTLLLVANLLVVIGYRHALVQMVKQ